MRSFDKILVTGGAGFIGSHVIRFMLAEHSNISIVNIDALTYAGNLENLSDVENPMTFLETNIMGTAVLLNAALDCWKKEESRDMSGKMFYHVSTDEVYGSLGDTGLFTETTAYDPRSPYSASKASSDHIVRAYHHTYDMPIIISNCSNNYGSHQYPEKLIPLMILNSLRGEKLPVYGDGMQIRDWIHAKDHARGILDTMDYLMEGGIGSAEVINFGADNEVTNLEIVKSVISMTGGSEDDIEFVEDAYQACKGAHSIALVTQWQEYRDLDFQRIHDEMVKPAFIFDGRNHLDPQSLHQIGFNVFPLGKKPLLHL